MNDFNGLDWAIIAIIGVSTLLSLKRGFFKEAFSLFIWLFAIFCSFIFSDQLSVYLHNVSDSPSIRKLAAMGILFIASLLIGGLVRFLISQLITFTGLTPFDRVLGMVFGGLRGVLIVIAVSIAMKKILPVEQEQWWKASTIAPHFQKLELWTIEKSVYLQGLIVPLLKINK